MEMLKSSDMDKLNIDDLIASLNHFGTADYVVFVLMLIMCLLIGIYWGFAKKQTNEDYLMGGRNMKILPVSMSLVASYISGISLLGIPSEIYRYGTQYMNMLLGLIFMVIMLIKIFLPVFLELKLTSSYQYLEMKYDWRVRLLASCMFVFNTTLWLGIVTYVPALAFNMVSGIDIHIIAPIICIVCIFYTCVGGLKAVVWTDVIQTIIMLGSLILVSIKGTIDVGGLSNVISRNWDSGRIEAPIFDPNPLVRHTIWSLMVGGSFMWLSTGFISQVMAQRFLSLPNLESAKKAACCFAVFVAVLISTCGFCGLVIFARYYDCDPLTTKLAEKPDLLLPLLVKDVLGNFPGFPGLFVAGIISAALSSLSTGLNSMAAVALEDFYRPMFKKQLSERHISIFMKSIVILVGCISIGLVFVVENFDSILQLSLTFGSIGGGPTLGLFMAGLIIPKVHSTGALWGGLVGLITMSWICIGAQINQKNGYITFEKMPLPTTGCTYTYHNSSLSSENSFITNEDILPLYRLSYMWYTAVGMLITMTVSTAISFVYNPISAMEVNPKYLAPFLRKYYDCHYEIEKITYDTAKIPLNEIKLQNL